MSEAPVLPPLVDSHCHLTAEPFGEDLEAVLDRMRAAGVAEAVVVGTGVADSRAARALAAGRPGLHPTAGIHPNEVPEDVGAALARLEAVLGEGDFVALGETGLDYYRDRVDRGRQSEAFLGHLELARRHDLPVVVHLRDRTGRREVFEDAHALLARRPGVRGVLHCYTGGADDALRFVEGGFFVSFAGILTFRNGANVREAARAVPLERTLVETDAPYLAPEPHRGARNEPAFVADTARALAALKGLSEERVRAATAANARALFRLPERASAGSAP
jgi:TatD DNase family protein